MFKGLYLSLTQTHVELQMTKLQCVVLCFGLSGFPMQSAGRLFSSPRPSLTSKHTHTMQRSNTAVNEIRLQPGCFCYPNRDTADVNHPFDGNKGNGMSVRTVWLCQEEIKSRVKNVGHNQTHTNQHRGILP